MLIVNSRKVTFKNLILALKDQGPLLRFLKNLKTGNVLGLFHERSHLTASGKAKVAYGSKKTAEKSASKMCEKTGFYYSNYKCLFCDGYHLGRNRDSKFASNEAEQGERQ